MEVPWLKSSIIYFSLGGGCKIGFPQKFQTLQVAESFLKENLSRIVSSLPQALKNPNILN